MDRQNAGTPPEAWCVVDEAGAVHAVSVAATPGQWRATAADGPHEGLANESSKSARRAVTAVAVRAGWEPAEILAPGVATRAEALRELADVANDVVRHALLHHPLPWRIEDDWTREVTAADGTIIAKCMTFARAEAVIALATAIRAELDAPDAETDALLAPRGS